MMGYLPKKSRFNVCYSTLNRDKSFDKSRLIIRFFNLGTTLILEIPKIVKHQIDLLYNYFEQVNSEIHTIKDKIKELDVKQLNELSDIESFFGIERG